MADSKGRTTKEWRQLKLNGIEEEMIIAGIVPCILNLE